MKIYSLYGAGFYYIPGTDTCIKIGGFMRAEVNFNANGSYAPYLQVNFDNIDTNRYYTRVRGLISFDVRSQTEYGTLRAYLDMSMQDNNGNLAGGTPYFQGQAGYANAGFVQFAGFTAGKTISFFDFDGQPYSNQTNFWDSNQGGNGIPVFAYTAQFGNGFSASLSAESQIVRRTTIIGTLPTTIAPSAAPITLGDGYGQASWPDIVGNLRVDQAWGSAQIMGAIHNVNSGYFTAGVPGTGSPGMATGWALGAGFKFNLPMLGKGDYVLAQFTYGVGAMNYVASGDNDAQTASNADGLNFLTMQNGAGVINGGATTLTTGFGPLADAVYGSAASGVGLQLTSGWSITGGYEHFWMPNLKTSLFGSYGEIDYNGAASQMLSCAVGIAGCAGSADWSLWQIGSRTVWTVVPNLDLSVEVMYQSLSSAFSGLASTQTSGGRAVYGVFDDKDWVSGMVRVQRNFYP